MSLHLDQMVSCLTSCSATCGEIPYVTDMTILPVALEEAVRIWTGDHREVNAQTDVINKVHRVIEDGKTCQGRNVFLSVGVLLHGLRTEREVCEFPVVLPHFCHGHEGHRSIQTHEFPSHGVDRSVRAEVAAFGKNIGYIVETVENNERVSKAVEVHNVACKRRHEAEK